MSRSITALAVLLGLWTASQADAAPTLSIASASGPRGGELVLTLHLLGTGQCAGISGRIAIPKGLSLQLVTNGTLTTDAPDQLFGQAHIIGTADAPILAFMVSFRNGRGLLTAPGSLVAFHFAVASDAPLGTFPTSFVNGSTAMSNADGTGTLPLTLQGGQLTITPVVPHADINHDGNVNAVDIQLVVNAVLGISIGDLDGDVNDDGSTNAVDIQLVVNAVLGIT